ncbi:MAG TPA: hypothetical protein VF544_21270 [Pyrinomonadaceae bacterium]|jgi:hypothetical protein
MQIGKRLKRRLSLIHALSLLLLTFGSWLLLVPGEAKGRFQATNSVQGSQSQTAAHLNYQFLTGGCGDKGICSAVFFVDAKHFNKPDLIRLARELRRWYRGKPSVGLYLFDDLELAKAYAFGNPGLVDFMSTARGLYSRDRQEEYIRYAESPTRPYPSRTTITLRPLRRKQRR